MADQPSRGRYCNFCITGLQWLLALGNVGYSTYLTWLLAHLKANNYYFLLVIPLFLVTIFMFTLWNGSCVKESVVVSMTNAVIPRFALITLMCCFTMLTRLAYYHLNPEDKYGPEFIVASLKGYIILIFFAFLVQREFKIARILEDKDMLNRAVLDFVDIFDLVELLSLNECVGVGLFVSENSHTERAIQAFCVMSFFIIMSTFVVTLAKSVHVHVEDMPLLEKVTIYEVYSYSALFQNIPFLVIRIVVWVQYNVYSLGFVVKNITSIGLCFAQIVYTCRAKRPEHEPLV